MNYVDYRAMYYSRLLISTLFHAVPFNSKTTVQNMFLFPSSGGQGLHTLHLKREIWPTSLTFRFLKLHLNVSDDDVPTINLETAVMLYFLNTHFRN